MPSKSFERNTAGLFDAILSEMEDIRSGVATPIEAQAFAQLAGRAISSLELDISASAQEAAKEERAWQRERREVEFSEKMRLERLKLTALPAPSQIQSEDIDDGMV